MGAGSVRRGLDARVSTFVFLTFRGEGGI